MVTDAAKANAAARRSAGNLLIRQPPGTGQEHGRRPRTTDTGVIGANEREVTRNLRDSALPNGLVRAPRQHEPQRGSRSGTAACRDLPAVGFDQAPGDGEAEAGAA